MSKAQAKGKKGKYASVRVRRAAGSGRFLSKAEADALPKNQWIMQQVRRLRRGHNGRRG